MLGAVLNCTEMDAAAVGAERRVGVKPGLPPWGPHVRFRRVQTLVREGSPLVKLRNSCLAAPMPAAGAVPARRGRRGAARSRPRRAAAAPRSCGAGRPAERHHRQPQFRCAADVAAFVKRDADFKPLVTHWVSSRIVPRTEAVHRMPVACGAGCKARTRTDEGAILR